MTHSFRNILYVVLDPASPSSSLADAMRVAGWFDASLTVQSVAPPVPRRYRRLGLQPAELARATVATLRSWVDQQLGAGPSDTPDVAAIHVDSGRLPVEVVSRVLRERHDLVVVAPSANADRLATVRRLARVCPCPLLVLRQPVVGGDVLVAVDPDDRLELNVMLLSVAHAWADHAAASVDAVHAYDPLVGHLEYGPFGASQSSAFAERVRAEHVEALDELVDRVGAHWLRQRHVVEGRPAEAIIETARVEQPELIVIGTAGRRMAALLIGNTADRILSRTGHSVLIVKPPGFVPQLDVEIDPAADEVAAGVA